MAHTAVEDAGLRSLHVMQVTSVEIDSGRFAGRQTFRLLPNRPLRCASSSPAGELPSIPLRSGILLRLPRSRRQSASHIYSTQLAQTCTH